MEDRGIQEKVADTLAPLQAALILKFKPWSTASSVGNEGLEIETGKSGLTVRRP